MKNRNLLLLICTTATILTSCQKEVDFQDLTNPSGGGNNNNSSLKGNWTLINLAAKTDVSITVVESGIEAKAITTSDYVTIDNKGMVTITDNQFLFKGIGHTINDQAHLKMYLDGILVQETDFPFNQTTPVADYTNDYVRNSNDSLTFTNATAFIPDPDGGATPVPAGPLGAKINITGDTLTLYVKYSYAATISQAGTPASYESKLESLMKFKRQ